MRGRASPPALIGKGASAVIIMSRAGSSRNTSTSPKFAVGTPKDGVGVWCSRSRRTTTAPTPIARSASSSTTAVWPSRPRMASGSTSGIASRNTNGELHSAWIGSSRVHPHSWRANDAAGTTNVRVPAACLSMYSQASTQSCDTPPAGPEAHVPTGNSRRDHAGEVATTAANTTHATCERLTLAANVPTTAPTASAIGKRIRGSNLWRLRKGASWASRSEMPQCAPASNAKPMANMATNSRGSRRSPTSPTAAMAQVASTNVGSVTSRWPAVRSASTNGAQEVVPRRISTGLSHAVVTVADSMKSVNGGA